MKVEIKINTKLRSKNQFKAVISNEFLSELDVDRMNTARARMLKTAQTACLFDMMASRQWDKLNTLIHRAAVLSVPIVFSIEYHQPIAYDDDNATGGANKTIIDALVRKGILPDDKPDHIKAQIPTFVKCKKGQEFIIATFEVKEKP